MAIKKVYSEDNHCDMWEVDYRVKLPSGKQKRIRKLYFSRDAAKKAIMRDKVAAENGTYASASKITLADWREKVLKYVRSHRKGSTIEAYEIILTLFSRIIGEGRKLESLDRSDLRRFVEYLRDQKKNDASTKVYLAKVKAALNLAPQLFQELIAWQPPSYRFEGYIKSRDRVLEDAEIVALLNNLDEDYQDIVLCALNTGARLREVLSLTWDRVLWNAPGYAYGAIKLRVTKTRGVKETFRIVPATKEVAEILQRRKQQSVKSKYVFPSPKKPDAPRNALNAALMAACEKAEIIYGRENSGGFVFHDLRRTAVTYLRRAGVDIETVCSITGHSPAVMLTVYSKANVESQQKAVDALAKILPFGKFKESAKNKDVENNLISSNNTEITRSASE
jgi:integrase